MDKLKIDNIWDIVKEATKFVTALYLILYTATIE